MAALIRIADGLDRGHDSAVTNIACDIRGGKVCFDVFMNFASGTDIQGAESKKGLFEIVFKKKAVFSAIIQEASK